MKKSIILIICLSIMVFCCFGYQLEIGNGSELGQHLPCDPFYRHSGSQLIYDSSYFPYVGTITQISFQYHFSSDNPEDFANNITLMIGEYPTNSFQDGDDFINLNLLNTCFEGNLTATNFQASDNAGNGWMVIDLTEAYFYSGSSNLILFLIENNSEVGLNSDNFLAFSTQVNTSMCFVDQQNPLDIDNLVDPVFIRSWLPNTIFEIIIDDNYPQAIFPDNNAIDVETNGTFQIKVPDLVNAGISLYSNNYECPIVMDNYQSLGDNVYEVTPILPFAPNSSYEWQVSYINGDMEYNSELFSFDTVDEQQDFSITQNESNSYSVYLEWDSLYNNDYSYVVYRDNEAISLVSENSYLDTEVLPGQSYEYQVRFYYIDESSLYTESVWIEVSGNENILIDEDFDSYNSFGTALGQWQNIDNDGHASYSLENYSYPNAGAPSGFVVFEPEAVTPPLDINITGNKCLVSFASSIPPTSDILISPSFQAYQVDINIFLRSFDTSWGMERVKLGLILNNNLDEVIYFNEGDFLEVPEAMINLTYDYNVNNETDIVTNVLIESCGIQTLMLIIDRIVVSSSATSNQDNTQLLVKPIISPNPIREGSFKLIEHRGGAELAVYNLKGQLVYKTKTQHNQEIKLPEEMTSGIYLLKIKTRDSQIVSKISVMK